MTSDKHAIQMLGALSASVWVCERGCHRQGLTQFMEEMRSITILSDVSIKR